MLVSSLIRAAAGLLLTVSAPLTAQPRALPNPPSGWSPPAEPAVVFPTAAGGYDRTTVTQYGELDWGVAYQKRDADGRLLSSVDTFFYVADGGCAAEFDGAVEALRERNDPATELNRGPAPSPKGGGRTARSASFSYDAPFGTERQPVRSHLYVYCHPGSRWTIKARMTAVGDVDLPADTAAVLSAIGWPASVAR